MISPDKLYQILGDRVSVQPSGADLPYPECTTFEGWVEYLERHFGLIAMPVRVSNTKLQSHYLWIARGGQGEVIIIFHYKALFGRNKYLAVNLETEVQQYISVRSIGELEEVSAIFDPFPEHTDVTFSSTSRYILKPNRSLINLTSFYYFFINIGMSALFISNFTILSFVLPSQNFGAYLMFGWVFCSALFSVFILNYLLQCAKGFLDTLIEERADLMKQSLLWSLPPTYLSRVGFWKVEKMCDVIVYAGKASAEFRATAILSTVIVPSLILMYLRLPTWLFTAVLLLGILGSLPSMLRDQKSGRLRHNLRILRAECDQRLATILAKIPQLNFFGATNNALQDWEYRMRQVTSLHARVSASDSLVAEMTSLLKDLAQLLAVIALTLIVSFSLRGGPELTISGAFIMMHLVSQVYVILPALTSSISQRVVAESAFEEAREVLAEISRQTALQKPRVTSIDTSVSLSKLRLPNGCRFVDGPQLSLNIVGSQVVSIQGESGTGKTTLLNCILGIIPPETGSVSVFGVNPILLSSAERYRIFAYSNQELQLLPGTIRDNILIYGSKGASDRKLWDALERVKLLETIDALPLGLDTPISDARSNFSTGEKQQMALAQCIIKKSSILVLDEAMSGLPVEVELEIFQNIRPLFDQIYRVSHRMNAQINADVVIALEDGSTCV